MRIEWDITIEMVFPYQEGYNAWYCSIQGEVQGILYDRAGNHKNATRNEVHAEAYGDSKYSAIQNARNQFYQVEVENVKSRISEELYSWGEYNDIDYDEFRRQRWRS